jgi:hypothetical protein
MSKELNEQLRKAAGVHKDQKFLVVIDKKGKKRILREIFRFLANLLGIVIDEVVDRDHDFTKTKKKKDNDS